jgi:3-dehydroquinate dehydratase-1
LSPHSIYSTHRRSAGAVPKIVAVILSPADLLRAKRLQPAPDFFELRLDALEPIIDEIESSIQSLDVPLIVTARHPREGGANKLSAARRTALLQRFLDRAAYVDIELRALRELRSVHHRARREKIGLIISFHDLNATPTVARLRAKARAAGAAGADIFKIATRTDTQNQLNRLLDFFDEPDASRAVAGRRRVDLPRRSAAKAGLPISAMGIGKLGRKARRELIKHGSVLTYGHLGHARLAGQPSISEIQRWTLSVER